MNQGELVDALGKPLIAATRSNIPKDQIMPISLSVIASWMLGSTGNDMNQDLVAKIATAGNNAMVRAMNDWLANQK